jgi:hypothetical protein
LRRRGRWSGGTGAATTAAATSLRRRSSNARRSERIRLSYAFPLRGGLRRTPAVLAKRRRGEGYSLEDAHGRLIGAEPTRENASFDSYLFGNHCRGVRDGRHKECGGEETFDSLHVFSFTVSRII